MSNKFNESFAREMKRFEVVDESTQFRVPHNRERTGGVYPGDRIKFKENITSSDWFKNQIPGVQELVKELRDGDLNLYIDSVTGEHDNVSAVVARELAPGLQCPHSKIEIPASLCEVLDTTGNRATSPIPDSWRGPERVTIKPEPVKPLNEEEVADSPENQTLKADDGSGKLKDTDHSLPEKDTAGAKGGSYTTNYMPKG